MIGAPNRITYVGHATVLVELDGARLLTDPLLRSRFAHLRRHTPLPDAEVTERIDAVLLSHLHLDHVDLRSLRQLGAQTLLLAPAGAGRFLRRSGFARVRELAPGDTAEVTGVEVKATPAHHEGRRGPLGPTAEAIGFDIRGTRRIYFAGDTDLFQAMEELAGQLELALLPVWGWGPSLGHGHLDPDRAARAAALLRPRIAVPIHWGTYFPIGLARWRGKRLRDPPLEFARRVAELAPAVEVRVLGPGTSLSFSA
jgi:L-ascorbate metabolism protein UlaG (beta-lactamase superfamily)